MDIKSQAIGIDHRKGVSMTKTVIAAALGECVHVAGISNFLKLAETADWRTIFLGPAVSIEKVLETARAEKADLVGISYRIDCSGIRTAFSMENPP